MRFQRAELGTFHFLIVVYDMYSALRSYQSIEAEVAGVFPKFYSELTVTDFQATKVGAVVQHIRQILQCLEAKS